MSLLFVNALAAYAAWGIISSLIPQIRAGTAVWRMPGWMRALAISGIAYGMYSVPPRYVHALACAAIVLFAMMLALKLGAKLPDAYTINLPARTKHAPGQPEMRGYSPAHGSAGRRVPRLD